jgi:hypothetical protein
MAEIRCPMCSQPNPEDAEVCVSCHARLKPLIANNGPSSAADDRLETPAPQADSGAAQGSDWLSRMRSGAAEPEARDEEQAENITPDATPDWLGRLRDTQARQADQQAEQETEPDWAAQRASPEDSQPAPDAQEGEVPDWLARIRQRESEEIVAQPEAPEIDDVDWRSRLGQGDSADVEDVEISARLMGQMEEAEADLGSESDQAALEFSQSAGDEPASAGIDDRQELPFMAEEPSSPASGEYDYPEEPGALDADLSEVELPWLASAESQPEPSPNEGDSSGLAAGEAAAFSEDLEFEWPEVEGLDKPSGMPWEGGAVAHEVPEEPAFDWLESGEPQQSAPPMDEGALPREEPEVSPAKSAEERIFGVELGLDADVPEVAEHVPHEAVEPPSSSALILGEEQPPTDTGGVDLSLDDIDLPDWLADMQGPAGAPGRGEIVDDAALAPATLPSWLEAMRPVDSFRSVMDGESADSQAVESAGPLAGLRGVLMAEPVVAMPHPATIGSAGLEVTERQFAQAELIQHILVEEEREFPPAQPARTSLPLLRWIISIVLVLSVAMPTFLPSIFFGVFPKKLFPDFSKFIAVVESLPTDAPALVVFDYPPGYNGELSTIAGPFLEHLVRRGVPIATLSTTPTGPLLAEAILSKYGENWTNYIHLGYLSGGPTAVQVFAAAPRSAVPRGFKIPTTLQDAQIKDGLQGERINSAWQSKLLGNVERLSDFSMVAVITAGPESARTWAEQAPNWMDGKPLIMVLSAGAEPLVRPYHESTNPQVQGIIAGMPTAVGYELYINGQTHAAENRWDAFGFGMFSVLLILLVGGLYGLGRGLWRLGMRTTRGGVDD